MNRRDAERQDGKVGSGRGHTPQNAQVAHFPLGITATGESTCSSFPDTIASATPQPWSYTPAISCVLLFYGREICRIVRGLPNTSSSTERVPPQIPRF